MAQVLDYKLDDAMLPFLADVPIFARLPAETLRDLMQAASLQRIARGDHVFLRGEKLSRLVLVVDGQLKLYRETRDGEPLVLSLPMRGDIIGAAAILAGEINHVSGQATEESWVLTFPMETMTRLVRDEPVFMNNVVQHMARQLRLLRIENEHLMLMSAPQRVGCLLLQHWRKTSSKGSDFGLQGKHLAAARLGMKPETFSRALAKLAEAGVKSSGSRITIENLAHLIDYTCESCSAAPGECKWSNRQSSADVA